MYFPRLARCCFVVVVSVLFSIAASAAERLNLPVPPNWSGWKEQPEKQIGIGTSIDRIPMEQDISSYSDIIVEQRIIGLKQSATMNQLLTALFTGAYKVCENLRVVGPTSAIERGYEVSYGQYTCSRFKAKKDRGVIAQMKAIRGGDAVYVVIRERIHNGFDAVKGGDVGIIPEVAFGGGDKALTVFRDMAETSEYLLKRVTVCNDEDPAHACQ